MHNPYKQLILLVPFRELPHLHVFSRASSAARSTRTSKTISLPSAGQRRRPSLAGFPRPRPLARRTMPPSWPEYRRILNGSVPAMMARMFIASSWNITPYVKLLYVVAFSAEFQM